MDAQTLITKLQADAATSLAALSVQNLLGTKVGALVSEDSLRTATRRALLAWLASPTALDALTAQVETLANRLQSERRAMKDVVSKDVKHAARELLGRPFSPDKKLVLTIIDRGPMRELVRQLLLDAVLEFGKRASAPVAGMARGLGSLAKLAGETVKSRTGGLGSLVGAVSGEVERQLEKRAVEFVDSALAGVFGQLADAISDPKRADEAAELRMAFFDGVLELTGPQLARELVNADVSGGAVVLREGLQRWLASPDSDRQLTEVAHFVLQRDQDRTLREVLTELGLLEVATELATEHLAARIRAIASTPEFAAWLVSLSP